MKKIAIVTGANSGLGFQTAKELYHNGYTVIFACRDSKKTLEAIESIKEDKLNQLDFIKLDLTDYNSILEFSKIFMRKYTHLDLLVNNAGVMMPPYTITKNNLELQLDANYMGHFYLTYLLYSCFSMSKDPRIVTVSSLAHKRKEANINFDNINFEHNYKAFDAYCQSKLAGAVFGYQLAERGVVKSIICHPGVSNTNLKRYFPKWALFISPIVLLFAPISKPHEGAESVVYACLNKNLESGDYVGPISKSEWRGAPGVSSLNPLATDHEIGRKLWNFSEEHLHIKFDL